MMDCQPKYGKRKKGIIERKRCVAFGQFYRSMHRMLELLQSDVLKSDAIEKYTNRVFKTMRKDGRVTYR